MTSKSHTDNSLIIVQVFAHADIYTIGRLSSVQIAFIPFNWWHHRRLIVNNVLLFFILFILT